MLMELGYFDYTQGTQRQASIQGYPINGLMFFVSHEQCEPDTYITVRTPQGTLVERIQLDYLHQISDFRGGNGDDDTADFAGFTYVDLGLVSLGDAEELSITIDCESAAVMTSPKIGVAALIDDLPDHDELIYHYQLHSDTSFSSDSAAGMYVFASSISTKAELVNVKLGEDTRSTTLRATNWYANLAGKIELDNSTMGVVFDNKYGQPVTVNHSAAGTTSIIRRVVQVAPARAHAATKRLARVVARKTASLDAQTKRAIP